jgi:hypothetical protein
MNFIVKLLRLRDSTFGKEYNSIFIITNRLTKEAKFVPFNKTTDTPNVAYTIMQEVVATEGLSDK